MAGLLRANVRLAIRSVRLSKWRSLLTLTGVVIGVAAFIVVVAIGEGIKGQVSGQISQLGKDLITIRAGQLDLGTPFAGSGSIINSGSLTSSDIGTVNKTKGVKLAAPLSLIASQPSYNGHTYSGGPVIATDQNLVDIINQPIAYGTFFSGAGSINSAIVGSSVAKDFFGEAVPLGDSFQLLGQRFVITGVFSQFDSAPFSFNANFNNSIFIRYDTANQLTNSHAPIYEILVKPDNSKDVNPVVKNLNRNLARAHGQHDFTVLTQNQSLGVTGSILSLITKMIIGVAVVALLVGGVGIMDVMLVSVAERTKEIGLRKAVGASSRQILKQFLVEALVLSAIGVVIGTLLSLLATYLIFLFSDLTPMITWQSIIIADAVALAVGIIFGTIPALKAARKNPIDALRNE